MRINYQSPDALVIRDSAGVLRAFGVFVALIGAAVCVANAGGPRGGDTVALVIGAVLALSGGLLALVPRTATFAFDKSQRAMIVTRRGLLRQPVREQYALRDVAGVELEERTDSDGDTMYRVATVMADGTRRPWTSYYSSGRLGKSRAVNAAREFLELPPRAGLAAPAAALAPTQRRFPIGCLGIFAAIFLAAGGWMAWTQHHRLATYRPVPVTVLSTRVEVSHDDDGSSYRPVVTYRYEVAGLTYTSSQVTPLKESRGRRWAYGMIDRFTPGATYTGYYDPTRPSASFLVRQHSAFPYLFMAVPLLMLAVVVHTARRQASDREERSGFDTTRTPTAL